MKAKFALGKRVVATQGVVDLMDDDHQFGEFVSTSLKKYTEGDWGDMSEEDCAMNDDAVKTGERIHGSYTHPDHKAWKIWIITEWDRSVTTILFPSEY